MTRNPACLYIGPSAGGQNFLIRHSQASASEIIIILLLISLSPLIFFIKDKHRKVKSFRHFYSFITAVLPIAIYASKYIVRLLVRSYKHLSFLLPCLYAVFELESFSPLAGCEDIQRVAF
jgi:Ca2+/Na+ antiporter